MTGPTTRVGLPGGPRKEPRRLRKRYVIELRASSTLVSRRPRTGSRLLDQIHDRLSAGHLITDRSASPGIHILPGGVVSHPGRVDAECAAGGDRPRQMIALTYHDQLRDAEDPLGPDAGVIGVEARVVGDHLLGRNAGVDQVGAHQVVLVDIPGPCCHRRPAAPAPCRRRRAASRGRAERPGRVRACRRDRPARRAPTRPGRAGRRRPSTGGRPPTTGPSRSMRRASPPPQRPCPPPTRPERRSQRPRRVWGCGGCTAPTLWAGRNVGGPATH